MLPFLQDRLRDVASYIPSGSGQDELHQLYSLRKKMGEQNFMDWIRSPDFGSLTLEKLYFYPPIDEVREHNMLMEIQDRTIRLADSVSSKGEPCPNCKSENTKSVEMQTRGGDEGQSVTLICNNCNQNFNVA